ELKNTMHACLMTAAAAAVVIIGTWGSMQYVLAQETSYSLNLGAAKSVAMDTEAGNTQTSLSADNTQGGQTSVSDNTTDSTTDKNGTVVEIKVSQIEGNTETDTDKQIAGILYSKLVMANVEEAVNVRAEASESAELVGEFYKECAGEILEEGSGWTKIKSGDLTGWVKDDYLLFGTQAQELAESVVTKTATSQAESLRVRKEPGEDAGIYGLLAKGDKIEALEELGDWVSVQYTDGTVGYVSSQYVTISDELGTGETIEAINTREEAEKKAEAKAKAAASTRTTETTLTNNGAITGDVNDVLLLAALIQCEAGNECYEGQVSVGTVVMNRLRTGKYGSSIYSVIYANGQFSPASSGQVAQVYVQGPKATCIAAAQEAMSGVSYVGTATKFRNIRSGYSGIVIGNHVFW
ncbi:MAG TPA: SH3 domain-containing protein, partial [Lachnospiraceae bacterium]|nr:SH3 domain-containing protein [Lachnospiraceae bacterium]